MLTTENYQPRKHTKYAWSFSHDVLQFTSSILARKILELRKSLSDVQGSTGSADRAAADRAANHSAQETSGVMRSGGNLLAFWRSLLLPSYTELQAAARHGPVIVRIAEQYSCSAIIVLTSGEPHHVRFLRITLTHLKRLKNDFVRKIRLTSSIRPEPMRKELQVLLRTV